MRFSTC